MVVKKADISDHLPRYIPFSAIMALAILSLAILAPSALTREAAPRVYAAGDQAEHSSGYAPLGRKGTRYISHPKPSAPQNNPPRLLCADPCDPVLQETYGVVSIDSGPTDRPAQQHADLNLILRGYTPSSATKNFVFYYGDADEGAPQLSGLFGDDRMGTFTSVYHVYDWDWSHDRRGQRLNDPEVTLAGLAVSPGEIIYVPPAGYTIGSGYDVLVLYASPVRVTLKYTREDNVVNGYTLHLENICVEPRLLALYESSNSNGRGTLPALQAGQAIGRARGNELGVAIRDNGVFMDPRSQKDWWRK